MRTICVRSWRRRANVVVGFPYTVCASSWMPTSMCAPAPAAGTPSPTASSRTATTTPMRLRNERLPPERPDHAPESLLELDLRFPAGHLARARDVRLAHLRIVDRKSLVDDLALRAGDAKDRLREVVHRELVRIAEVHRQVLVGLRERDETADQIVHVAKASRLRPVAEHCERFALERLPDKRRNRATVVRPHPRSVRVEDPRDRRVDSLLPVVGHRHRLGVALRLVVDAARADGIDVAPVGLRLRMHLRVAVDLARRGEEEAGALELRETQRVVRAVRAHLEGLQRQPRVVDRAGRAREVVDELDRLLDPEVLRHVLVHECEALASEVLDVLERSRVEVVHADNAEVLRDEVIAEMRAEEPGP